MQAEGHTSVVRILVWIPCPISRGPIQWHSKSILHFSNVLFLISKFSFLIPHFSYPTCWFPLHVKNWAIRVIQWCFILELAKYSNKIPTAEINKIWSCQSTRWNMKSIEWKDLDARCRKWEVRNQKLEIRILNAHIPFPTSHITFWDQTIEFCPEKWEMRFKRGFSRLKCSPPFVTSWSFYALDEIAQ